MDFGFLHLDNVVVMLLSAGDTTTYALDVISTSKLSWWNSFTPY